jgi:hypothetical protein
MAGEKILNIINGQFETGLHNIKLNVLNFHQVYILSSKHKKFFGNRKTRPVEINPDSGLMPISNI